MRGTVLFLMAACLLPSCSRHADLPGSLPVPHLRQEKLLCVPTSAAMILSFYGDPQSPRRLKALSSGATYDPNIPFDDFTITPFRDIISGLQHIGYAWHQQSLPDDMAGLTTGLGIIRYQLELRHPVMIDLSLPYGHTVVVSGYDASSGKIMLVDPDQPDPGTIVLSVDQLGDEWNETAYGGNFRSYIVTQPK